MQFRPASTRTTQLERHVANVATRRPLAKPASNDIRVYGQHLFGLDEANELLGASIWLINKWVIWLSRLLDVSMNFVLTWFWQRHFLGSYLLDSFLRPSFIALSSNTVAFLAAYFLPV